MKAVNILSISKFVLASSIVVALWGCNKKSAGEKSAVYDANLNENRPVVIGMPNPIKDTPNKNFMMFIIFLLKKLIFIKYYIKKCQHKYNYFL